MLDPTGNFIISTVDTAPDTPDEGLTLTVDSVDEGLFTSLMVTGAFNAVVWPLGVEPRITNAEIIRITDITDGVFTIERGQEGTTARNIASGWNIAVTPTSKTITDIWEEIELRFNKTGGEISGDATITDGNALELENPDGDSVASLYNNGTTGVNALETDSDFKSLGNITANNLSGTNTGDQVIPEDVSDLTDTTGIIPADVSDLTDTTGVIPADVSDLTDTTGIIPALDGWTPVGETLEYVSVDDPTGIFRVNADVTTKYSAGMRVKFTNGGNVIYGIITVVGAYSGGYTNITFLHQIDPTDNLALVLMANSAITLSYYSTHKAPVGFPSSPLSWSIISTPDNFQQLAATSATWYEGANITLPIGVWDFNYRGNVEHVRTAGGSIKCYLAANISQTSASATVFQSQIFYEYFRTPEATVYLYIFYQTVGGSTLINLTEKDVFYFNVYDQHDDTATLYLANIRFEAICAYL